MQSQVWVSWLPLSVADTRLLPLLGAREWEQAQQFAQPSDQARRLLGRVLVRCMAARFLEQYGNKEFTPATLPLRQECPECGSLSHGSLTICAGHPVYVSVTHAGGWVGAAVANTPVGIDVEADTVDPAWVAGEAKLKSGGGVARVIAAPPAYQAYLAYEGEDCGLKTWVGEEVVRWGVEKQRGKKLGNSKN